MWNSRVYSWMEAESDCTTARVAWISNSDQPHTGVEFLVEYLEEEGFAIKTVTLADLKCVGIWDYQVILFESWSKPDSAMLRTIVKLRVQTLALIVVLLHRPTSEDVAQTLGTGADAVWVPEEPKQVLRARARALLRRWATHLH